MKVTIEKVERLMERADIGYETARDALETADGDLLEAVIALERSGKMGANAGKTKPAAYSTEGECSEKIPKMENNKSSDHRYSDESTAFADGATRFFRWLGRVLRASVVNCFEIWRKGERVVYFPVATFFFCLIPWVFFVTLVLLIIGLFCGWRYRFSGPHLGRQSMNEAMDRMADIAEEEKANDRKDSDR